MVAKLPWKGWLRITDPIAKLMEMVAVTVLIWDNGASITDHMLEDLLFQPGHLTATRFITPSISHTTLPGFRSGLTLWTVGAKMIENSGKIEVS